MLNLKAISKISKLLISFFTFAFLLFTFSSPALAQSPASSSTTVPLSSTIPSYIPPTSPLYTDMLLYNMFHTFSCVAVGQSVIGQPCLTYQVTKNVQGAIQGVPVLSSVNLSGGVLGATTSLIGALYENPPVRTADYLASVGQDLGIVKQANAQVVGSGANVLSPILKLWQVSRNISYVIMIIIFIIVGLMVMFRNRINPQTVITAQAALPGLVIGLILITFSYFLAGLISDTAFLGTNIVGYYFQAAQTHGDINQNLTQITTPHNVLTIFSRFAGLIGIGDIQQAVQIIFDNVSGDVQGFMRAAAAIAAFQFGSQVGHVVPVIGELVGVITGALAIAATAADTPLLLGWVFSYVAMAALIYAMLKLLLKLVNNYLTIIFLTIIAPFQFLFASLPGRQGFATSWILRMLSNVLAFPAVLAVFYFVAFLLGRPQQAVDLFHITDPATIAGTNNFPLLGGFNLSFLQSLLAFGALVATPAIPDIIARTIGSASQAGQIIGQEISGGLRSGQGYAQQYQQRWMGTASSIGQSYQNFRGKPPMWSPARELEDVGWNVRGKQIIPQMKIPGLGARKTV